VKTGALNLNSNVGTGADCNGGATTRLASVDGVTNYASLRELHLYMSGLSHLSLAGCTNLVVAALVGTSPDQATGDAWFNDLAAAQVSRPSGAQQLGCNNTLWFYYPATPGPSQASAAARAYLAQWWTFWP
jgi:hypothetical protein